jgi:hypothetical protein
VAVAFFGALDPMAVTVSAVAAAVTTDFAIVAVAFWLALF